MQLTKDYEFWQPDSLPFELLNKETFKQKLDYIHNNPNAEHGNYAKSLLITITLQQSFMKQVLMILGFFKEES